MFECRFINAKLIKSIVAAIVDQMSEINLNVTSTELSSQSMDSAHVSLAALSLLPNCCTVYRVDRAVTLGLSLKNLKMILNFAADSDLISWQAAEDTDELIVMIENAAQTRRSSYKLKLMDIDTDNLHVPETVYSCCVTFRSDALLTQLKQLSKLGDTIDIRVEEKSVTMSVSGDLGVGEVILNCLEGSPTEDIVKIEWDDEEKEKRLSLRFALPYLLKFASAKTIAEHVTLSFSDQLPLKFQYEIQEAGEKCGHLTNYLAPKIDDDDLQPENVAPVKTEKPVKVKKEPKTEDDDTNKRKATDEIEGPPQAKKRKT